MRRKIVPIFFVCLFVSIIFASCGSAVVKENISDSGRTALTGEGMLEETPKEQAGMQALNEEVDLSLYIYGEDDYEKPREVKKFTVKREEYEKNTVEVINNLFSQTEIRVNNVAFVQNDKLVVADLTEAMAEKFDRGSCEGIILANELVMTLLHLPDVEKAKVTVAGEEGQYGNHYNFDGVFIKNGDEGYELSTQDDAVNSEYTKSDSLDAIEKFYRTESLTELFDLYDEKLDGAYAESYGSALYKLYKKSSPVSFVKELGKYEKKEIDGILSLLAGEVFIEEDRNGIDAFEKGFEGLMQNKDFTPIEVYIVYETLASVKYFRYSLSM